MFTRLLSDRPLVFAVGGGFLLALLVRLLWQAVVTPVDWPDTALYLADGDGLFAAGRAVSNRYMPLYPLVLHLFGTHWVLPLQAVLSALTVALVAWLGFRLFQSRTVALVAGVIAAGHPLLIFYANMRLTETLFLFLLTAALVAFYERRWRWGSVLLVLSILTRPAIDLIAPLLVLCFCVVHGESLSVSVISRRLGTYAVVYVALMSPWWLHNYQAYGQFVRLDLGDGIMLRLENNTLFDQVGLDFPALGPVIDEFDGLKHPVAINEARKHAAFDYVVSHPVHFLWRCLERLGRFWTPVPGSPTPAVNWLAAAVTLPVLLGAGAALAFGGRGVWRRCLPLLLLAVFLSAVHGVSHALPRYRLPLEALLIALAAGCYGPLIERLCHRERGRGSG